MPSSRIAISDFELEVSFLVNLYGGDSERIDIERVTAGFWEGDHAEKVANREVTIQLWEQ
jgi:hypothetical protein